LFAILENDVHICKEIKNILVASFFGWYKVAHFLWDIMPCPSTGLKKICAFPNFSSKPKNFITFSASSKTFVPAQKPNFSEWKSSFGVEQNVWDWHKIYINGEI